MHRAHVAFVGGGVWARSVVGGADEQSVARQLGKGHRHLGIEDQGVLRGNPVGGVPREEVEDLRDVRDADAVMAMRGPGSATSVLTWTSGPLEDAAVMVISVAVSLAQA